jgi:hypothetical protein
MAVQNHREIGGSQFMKAFVLAIMLTIAAGYPLICAQQSSKSDSKKQDKQQKDDDADKAADKILADTKELQIVPRWYEQVYPALKRKYKKPVSYALYDAWRERYFQNEVAPLMLKYGYGLESARHEFMERTEKQPAN